MVQSPTDRCEGCCLLSHAGEARGTGGVKRQTVSGCQLVSGAQRHGNSVALPNLEFQNPRQPGEWKGIDYFQVQECPGDWLGGDKGKLRMARRQIVDGRET
jgi:hypothetical protein